jgi:hypothetical protein
MPRISSSNRSIHSEYIRGKEQTTKFLIINPSTLSWPKFSPQEPVLGSLCLRYCLMQEAVFHSHRAPPTFTLSIKMFKSLLTSPMNCMSCRIHPYRFYHFDSYYWVNNTNFEVTHCTRNVFSTFNYFYVLFSDIFFY